jgi:lariat debranching enzyme
MEALVNVVCVGCTHGELDVMYAAVARLERETGLRADLVLCCGDFQAVRDEEDLRSMAAPAHHRRMQDFHHYHAGRKRAPVPTVFIGGNHEATAHLLHMPLGGWVAPDIYYLGHCGVVTFGGLRIGGVSGIFKGYDCQEGHWERAPLTDDSMRSAYHSRALDAQLLSSAGPLDVMLSHDWPRSAAPGGDSAALVRAKPGLAEDIGSGKLGSPLLDPLAAAPHRLWFAAHLHVAYAALLPGGARFLALDKPLPGRHFCHWVRVPVVQPGPKRLAVDGTWLAVLRAGLTPDFFGRGRTPRANAFTGQAEEPLDCGEWAADNPGAVTSAILQRIGQPSLTELRAVTAEQPQTKRWRPDDVQVTGPPPKDPNALDISDEEPATAAAVEDSGGMPGFWAPGQDAPPKV